MKLSQFINNYPEKMFVRFFYDVQYEYGVIKHCCLYVKYDINNPNRSIETFYSLFNTWSANQLDNKQKIRGYDRVFKALQLKKEIKNLEKYNVEQEDKEYYFLEII